MKNILKKLAEAKKFIASQKMTKEWKNTFSNYSYFTPEQVAWIVQEACEKFWLLTKFDLIRDELWIEWQLTIFDVESEEQMTFIGATAIPEIKATNIAQQIGWCMTFCERYLKQTAFWIADNSLDFDTTENTEKRVKDEKKSEAKEWSMKPTTRFNDPELEQLKANDERVRWFETSNALIEQISTKYKISKEMKMKIADVRAEIK